MKQILLLLACVLLSGALFSGCVAVMGNTEQARKTTLGQELIDIKRAFDAGVITESEYEAQKARLLRDKK